jgi:hypothetical protein
LLIIHHVHPRLALYSCAASRLVSGSSLFHP